MSGPAWTHELRLAALDDDGGPLPTLTVRELPPGEWGPDPDRDRIRALFTRPRLVCGWDDHAMTSEPSTPPPSPVITQHECLRRVRAALEAAEASLSAGQVGRCGSWMAVADAWHRLADAVKVVPVREPRCA